MTSENRKTSEAQIRAVRKYEQEKVDRINCRLPKKVEGEERTLKELIQEQLHDKESINDFIIKAVMEKLARIKAGE